jgi:hypothetical protein
MPDAEYVVTTWLRSDPDVLATGAHVDVRYPGTIPAVVVERVGGTADYLAVVDHPRLDVGVWAASKVAALDLGSVVRQAVHAINGQVVGDAQCGSVTEFLGLRFLPDEATETARYLFSVEITMRAVVPQ